MNVYDFDKTIFEGDSTVAFLKYLFLSEKGLWRALPGVAVNALTYALRLRAKQDFKQRLFSAIFPRVTDIDKALGDFWDKNLVRIMPWYVKNSRFDDVVISASPEFLVKYACDKLGVKLALGSPVDKYTGKYFGKNCHGDEKVARFRAACGDALIENFYSDSHSDDPMARMAQSAFMVRGNRLEKWRFDKN